MLTATGKATSASDDSRVNTQCVRGEKIPSNKLTKHSDSIVVDRQTGLYWQEKSNQNWMNWEEAIKHCESMTLGGYEDWRLPNINELMSLVPNHIYPSWSSTSYSSGETAIGAMVVSPGYLRVILRVN
ncbi:MAG: DUF1566 domain-containing protein [Epsilonproteobacteria bacterium]|nr:DUF1566 domain-containing protein [Campylobacterota bacterium]